MGRIRAALAVSVVGFVALIGPAAAGQAAPGPGCAPNRKAVAHYPRGVIARHVSSAAPIPCGMQTGYAGGESAIAVTNTGAVFYAPAVQQFAGIQAQYFLGGNSGFARTTNAGRSWTFVLPISPNLAVPANPIGKPGYPAWDQIDDKFYVDRGTGRLFWTDPDIPSEAVLSTDNDGVTWNYSLLPVGFGGEWTQVTTGKPRTSKTSGYPKVVYACGEYDSIGRDFTTKLEGDLCQKSLDGGQTWITAGQSLFGSPIDPHRKCGGQTEHPNFSPWAAPDPKGRLYQLLFCGGKTYLMRSGNEGASWPIAARVPYKISNVGPGGTGSAELRTDSRGNLYLGWTNPGNPNPNSAYRPSKLYLATSHDRGRTWSRPVQLLAPGVQGIRTHFGFDVGRPGHLAVSYLGHRAGRLGFDGYITETSNALARRPLLWSAVVNSPSQAPLDFNDKGSSNGLGLDYVSVAIGPHGTPWASFWDACGEDVPQTHASCPPSRHSKTAKVFGFMDYTGRLAPPARQTHRKRGHRCHDCDGGKGSE